MKLHVVAIMSGSIVVDFVRPAIIDGERDVATAAAYLAGRRAGQQTIEVGVLEDGVFTPESRA
jgi:hypothetical protein